MHRIEIASGVAESVHIRIGDGFLHAGRLADLKVFVIDRHHVSARIAALAPTPAAANISPRCWAV